MHAVGTGFRFRDKEGMFAAETLDAPLIALEIYAEFLTLTAQPFAGHPLLSIQRCLGNKLRSVVRRRRFRFVIHA